MTGFVVPAVDTASKVPYIIAGGLLVLLALSVSALGVRSETFPRTRGLQLVLIAVTVVLVAAAMSTAVITA